MSATIAFAGELYWDHVFVADASGALRYEGGRGGGSAANSAFAVGHEAVLLATRGDDDLGLAAEHEMRSRGVDVRSRVTTQPTRQIFEVVRPGGPVFSTRCPVCEQRHLRRSVPVIEPKWAELGRVRWLGLDGLGAARARLAREAAAREIRTAAHLSFPGQLRFDPATQIVAWLRGFEIVVLEHPVAESLIRRLRLPGIPGLTRHLSATVVISRPGENVEIHGHGRRVQMPWPLPADADPTGISDLIFGRGLVELQRGRSGVNAVARALGRVIADLPEATCLPGARAYARAPEGPSTIPASTAIATLAENLRTAGICPVCRSVTRDNARRRPAGPPPATPPRASARRNVSRVVQKMLLAAEKQAAVDSAAAVLGAGGSAYAVGSGGSFAVAAMISALMGRRGGAQCQPMRPNDYVELGVRTDSVIVVTYSGSTLDCAEVIRRARELHAGRVVLVTGAPDPALAELLDHARGDVLITYGTSQFGHRSQPEGGFVSIAGVLAPAAVWTAAATRPQHLTEVAMAVEAARPRDREIAERLADAVRAGASLALLTHGRAWPAALDVESKVTEGDLADVQLHELKDFSHGRFMSVMNAGRVLRYPVLIAVGERTDYEDALLRAIRAELFDGAEPQDLRSALHDDLGALEMLARVQFLSAEVGLLLHRDISRPEYISPGGLELYRWRASLRLPKTD